MRKAQSVPVPPRFKNVKKQGGQLSLASPASGTSAYEYDFELLFFLAMTLLAWLLLSTKRGVTVADKRREPFREMS